MGANGTHGTQNGTHSDMSYEEQILNLVRMNNKITRKQMAQTLSISLRTVQRILNSMDNLTYIGSGREDKNLSGRYEPTSIQTISRARDLTNVYIIGRSPKKRPHAPCKLSHEL